MEYPKTNDIHFVRCLKCLKILKCSRYDTSALLDHIRQDHPEIEIVDSRPNGDKRSSSVCAGSRGSSGPNTADVAKLSEMTGKSPEELARLAGVSCRSNADRLSTRTERVASVAKDPHICDEQAIKCNNDENKKQDPNMVYTRRYQVNTPSTSHSAQTPRKKRHLYRTSIEKWRPANGTLYCPKCGATKRPLIKTRSERLATNSCGAACLLSCWPFCFLPCLFPTDNKEYLHCSCCKTFLGLYDRKNNCVKPNKDYVEGGVSECQEQYLPLQ